MRQPRADGTGFGCKGTARHRAGTNRAAGAVWTPIFLARRCGPEMQTPRASVSASKIPSGPSPRGEEAVRTRIPSAPAPSRHRIPDRRGPPAPLLRPRFFSSESNTPRRGLFLNEARSSNRRSTSPPLFPENLRPSTRHRDPMLTSILTSTKQRISKTTKQGASKTMCQHNSTTTQQRVSKTAQQENKRAMNSRRQDFSTSVLTSVIQSVRQSVRTAVSTEVRQSDAFSGLQHPTGLFVLTGFVPDAGFGNGWFASSDWPANKRERGVIFDPFLSPRNIICFGTQHPKFICK